MPTPSRRSVLLGAAAAPIAFRATGVRTTTEEHPAVVVGSGFGGGVASLRLVQAGVPVLLLERGRRWPTGPNSDTFPRLPDVDERALWYESAPQVLGRPVVLDPYVGLLQAIPGRNMTIMCAAGLGGGSLVYQGMSLVPSRAAFEEQLPAALDWGTMTRVHYPRVARMLRLATAPDELVASPTYRAARVFARRAAEAGYAVSKIPMPIDWSFALAELRGEMAPSYTTGNALGINNGGKHTIDVTYLAAAARTGLLTVRTQHQVTDVVRLRGGRWQVHVHRIASDGTVLERVVVTTPMLVLGAGSANTTMLLMRAKARGTVPGLPDTLGTGWGSNGDRIVVWTNPLERFGTVQGGPVVYGSKDWADPTTANTVIQASLSVGTDLGSTMIVGFGASPDRGRFVWDGAKGQAVLHWPATGDARLQRRIRERMERITGPLALLGDTNAVLNSTWHPLGGAAMGSVCDLEGRVHGQPGLYVLDGALIPGSTAACNPSMTIAAVVERAMDRIVTTDLARA